MGEVFEARDRRLGRRVAIKHIRPEDDGPLVERFRREARSIAALDHPAVIRIFDVIDDASGPWIVMELLPGPSLARLLRDGPLEPAQALDYGRQVAEGLAAAHGAGVAHRDLKTENVMLAADGRVKILDFGLAKRFGAGESEETLTARGEILGTARCMSPEQARGLGVDGRSDLFSLGVLLYELLSGTSPFRGKTSFDTLTRVATHAQTPLRELDPTISAPVSDFIDRLLEKSPADRPAPASRVAETLAALARGIGMPGATFPDPEAPDPGLLRDTVDESGLLVGTTATHIATETRTEATVEIEGASIEDARPLADAELEDGHRQGDSAPRRAPERALSLRSTLLALSILGGVLALVVGLGPSPTSDDATVDGKATDGTTIDGPAGADEVAPPSTYSGDAFERALALLRDYDRQGQVEQAALVLRQQLLVEPERAVLYAGLAKSYWLLYRTQELESQWLDKAAPLLDRAAELDPDLPDIYLIRGILATEQRRFEAAETAFARAEQLAVDAPELLLRRGQLAFRRGRLEQAEELIREAGATSPDSREINDFLGTLLFRRGSYGEAEEVFRRSIALDERAVTSRSSLAATLFHLGRVSEAARLIQEALRIETNAPLYSNLGSLLFYQGLYEQAAEAYEKSLGEGKGSHRPLYWANLGDAYRQIPGREEKARETFLRATQLLRQEIGETAPDPETRSRLALFLAKAESAAEARAELGTLLAEEQAGEVKVGVGALYRSAMAYEILGDRRAALDSLSRALERGFPRSVIDGEPELEALRADPDFHLLLVRSESGGAP